MSLPIARRVENAFLSGLRDNLSRQGLVASRLPGHAGRAKGGATAPFYVVRCAEAENTTTGSNVFKVEVQITLVSSIDDSTSAEHDTRLSALEIAINSIPQNAIDEESGVRIFGYFLESLSTSTEDQNFGDVLIVQAGVGKV